ncbi:hypothetical protein D3C72_1217800 [compost metagenome]
MSAIEISAMNNAFTSHINQRIVIGTVKLCFDQRSKEHQGILQNPDDMRSTTNRITILQTTRFSLNKLIAEFRVNPFCDLGLTFMWFRFKEELIEVMRISHNSDGVSGRDFARKLAKVLCAFVSKTSERCHDGRAVHDSKTFFRF